MTRAEQLLDMIDEAGVGPRKSAFRSQWKYNPGQKVPIHLQIRKEKQKQISQRSAAAFTKPWQGQHDDPKDKSDNPLDKKYKPISVRRTG